MKNDRRLYFLQLKKDFFKRHDIKIVTKLGLEYLVTYLQLLCESLDHGGQLRYSETSPYTFETLAAVFDQDAQELEKIIQTLIGLELVAILDDGTIFMTKLNEMVSCVVDSPEANKKRDQRRETLKAETQAFLNERGQGRDTIGTQKGHERDNIGTEPGTDFPDNIENRIKNIEYRNTISKDIHTSSDIHKSEHTIQNISSEFDEIIAQFNSICLSLPKVSKLTETRKKAIKARLKDYSVEDLIALFERAEASDFLSGRSKQWTGCSFDWLLKPGNLIKVLEGNYDNKGKPSGSYIDAINNRYNVVDEWLERRNAKND